MSNATFLLLLDRARLLGGISVCWRLLSFLSLRPKRGQLSQNERFSVVLAESNQHIKADKKLEKICLSKTLLIAGTSFFLSLFPWRALSEEA